MTSNCLIEPQPAYRNRIFTTGPVGWPGIRHVDTDLSLVVGAAQSLPGFTADVPGDRHHRLRRGAVLSVADKVIEAVKAGDIKQFLLIGGCDGAAPGRNYYTDVADHAPADTVLMTLGCNKYRFNTHDFGGSAASRACSTSASATTATRPSRSRWPWPTPSTAASTICR